MLRVVSASALVASGALLLTGCSNLAPGLSSSTPAAAVPANCSGGVGPSSSTAQAATGPGSSGIVAHGSCAIIGTPDTATVTVNVAVQAVTARAALDGANAKGDAVVGGFRGKGVNPQDVRNGPVQVIPVVSPIITSTTGVGGTRVTGFLASRQVTGVVHDMNNTNAAVSSVIDAAGDSGTVQVVYSVANDSALRAQARAAAVRVAQDQAKQMADAAGAALGQLVSITDVPQPPPSAPKPSAVAASGSGSAPAPVSAAPADDGQVLQESVDLVYAVG